MDSKEAVRQSVLLTHCEKYEELKKINYNGMNADTIQSILNEVEDLRQPTEYVRLFKKSVKFGVRMLTSPFPKLDTWVKPNNINTEPTPSEVAKFKKLKFMGESNFFVECGKNMVSDMLNISTRDLLKKTQFDINKTISVTPIIEPEINHTNNDNLPKQYTNLIKPNNTLKRKAELSNDIYTSNSKNIKLDNFDDKKINVISNEIIPFNIYENINENPINNIYYNPTIIEINDEQLAGTSKSIDRINIDNEKNKIIDENEKDFTIDENDNSMIENTIDENDNSMIENTIGENDNSIFENKKYSTIDENDNLINENEKDIKIDGNDYNSINESDENDNSIIENEKNIVIYENENEKKSTIDENTIIIDDYENDQNEIKYNQEQSVLSLNDDNHSLPLEKKLNEKLDEDIIDTINNIANDNELTYKHDNFSIDDDENVEINKELKETKTISTKKKSKAKQHFKNFTKLINNDLEDW